jgi:LMBR1 domain-containing protein 1
LEEDYETFDTELKIKGTHPIVYVVSLIAGIVGVVASVFWFVQILGTMILKNGSPLFLFMDQWLSSLSASSVAFFATILYALLVLYLQACLAKGNTIFGIRIPFVLKIHPLLLNKTFMNSLLFNANLMLLASLATTLLALWAFPTYLGGSSLGRMSSQGFDQLPLFSAIYGKRIPMIVMEAVAVLTVVVIGGGAAWRKWRGKTKTKEEKEK